MAVQALRITAPLSPYRDCEVVFMEPKEASTPARAMCTDVGTGLIIGSPSVGADPREGDITPEEVIRLIGGTYRLAAIAIDIGTEELASQTRRISDELRMRRRLWRRRRKASRRREAV
ncbi:hypothetical protein ABIB75_004221 [Bradyrhizobium sp. GM2.2]|uniref:hypothetical protein n=1 Tax=Bradyrhizobium sp. GM2.2 TaxID=3156358 RepID=UPI003390C0D6